MDEKTKQVIIDAYIQGWFDRDITCKIPKAAKRCAKRYLDERLEMDKEVSLHDD